MNEATTPESAPAFIARCRKELARQHDQARGWPDPLRLPRPRPEHQRVAQKLWLAELGRVTATTFRVEFDE